VQDYWLTEAAIVAAKVLDVLDPQKPVVHRPRLPSCDHGFVDQGKGRCELCDPELAARLYRERKAHQDSVRRGSERRRRIGA